MLRCGKQYHSSSGMKKGFRMTYMMNRIHHARVQRSIMEGRH